MLGSGGGMIVHSTSTPILGEETGRSSGNLLFYGPLGPVQLSAGVDYGGAHGMRAGVLRTGVERTFENSWSLYAYGEKPLGEGVARFDAGAVRDLGGVTLSTFVGGSDDGAGYVGLRLKMPLSAAARQDRWLGF
jgi:hypothetical protein